MSAGDDEKKYPAVHVTAQFYVSQSYQWAKSQ